MTRRACPQLRPCAMAVCSAGKEQDSSMLTRPLRAAVPVASKTIQHSGWQPACQAVRARLHLCPLPWCWEASVSSTPT